MNNCRVLSVFFFSRIVSVDTQNSPRTHTQKTKLKAEKLTARRHRQKNELFSLPAETFIKPEIEYIDLLFMY